MLYTIGPKKEPINKLDIKIGAPEVIMFIGALNITSIDPLINILKVIKFSKKAYTSPESGIKKAPPITGYVKKQNIAPRNIQINKSLIENTKFSSRSKSNIK
tara:strand:+ start:70 stop:375 length:306 start_codon:yes stop_codon:yes gene_type:complete